ncbi:glycoside hydrolase family 79 protein [Sistotremastrum suecicum HHB10207 ss-3]|uniref:Glycoside hydrolase family 79 protein n=1 Tax=Sistotremastrum suecicum HHB10207 ss-3 TaxID=1314776 RepID=A0A166GTP3_9AGAM|nr:glycoside hydrolase family 79 protein [Sistotremastrum suecicum HHB10207 ss-3]
MLPLSLLILSAAPLVQRATCLTVTVPLTAPTAAVSVSSSLVSFSIEGDNWPDWVGTSSPNTFTNNVLNNLKTLTGSPPDIRVGANSEDRTLFSNTVPISQTIFPADSVSNPYPEASNVTVGDGYYALSRFLPSGTHMTWGINFGSNNLTAAIDEGKSILKAFSSDAVTSAGIHLDLIEIGNEPDLYGGSKRASSWNIGQYVSTWSSFAESVASAIGLQAGTRPFVQGLAFGNSDHGAGGFSPQQAYNDGILSTSAGKLITVVSQHHYSGGCCTALVSDLMSKSFVRGNVTAFVPDIQATVSRGHKFIFGETNSYFNHGVPDVSDASGAAIWLTDYSLFAATLGVANLYFHEGVGYKYNLIQPVTLTKSTEDATPLNPPVASHIQAPYYGAIVIAEFLGTNSNRTVSELDISSSSTISGYALYGSNGMLEKALLIDSQAFLTTTSGARPSTAVTLKFSGSHPPTKQTLKRLAIGHADDKTGLKWGGQTYETSSGLASGTVSTTSSNVSAGVTISATEVVLITFSN